jgi:hypothetical protein
LFDAFNRVIGNAPQHRRQVSFRINPVQLRRTEQTIDCRSTLTAGIGTGKQIVFALMRS